MKNAEDKKRSEPATPPEQRIASTAPRGHFDPIENAMQRHPGLTRAKAEEIAESFGF